MENLAREGAKIRINKLKIQHNEAHAPDAFSSLHSCEIAGDAPRYTGGFWQSFVVGADFVLSLHPIFFSDNFAIERQRKNSRNTILKPKNPETHIHEDDLPCLFMALFPFGRPPLSWFLPTNILETFVVRKPG